MKRRHFLGTLTGASFMAQTGFSTTGYGLPNGYYVPAEEVPHERTFMQWPNSRKVYRDPVFMRMTQQVIADIANTIVEFEPVVMLADKADHARIRKLISSAVELWDIPTEDLWCRDAGPLFAVHPSKGLAISNLNFNGWGKKQVHRRDGKIAAHVAERLGVPIFDSGLHGEAGGVEQDGHGTLIAHESSWVIDNRNPISKADIEARLLAAYGADKMVWAKGVKGQDITDYHIDSLARFTGHGQVLIQLHDDPDPSDPWADAAFETHDVLASATGSDGRALKLSVIPEPTKTRVKSLDFVAAYANYYVCNGGVISAQFGDSETDTIAKKALEDAYPNREIIALNVDALGELGGGIHCATQQQPIA